MSLMVEHSTGGTKQRIIRLIPQRNSDLYTNVLISSFLIHWTPSGIARSLSKFGVYLMKVTDFEKGYSTAFSNSDQSSCSVNERVS